MTREQLLKAIEETLGTPSPQRSSASWRGFYAPLGQPSAPANRDDTQPWPYRTETAEVLWKYVKDLIPKHPEMNEEDILKKAIDDRVAQERGDGAFTTEDRGRSGRSG